MITKSGFTKFLNFMTPDAGVFVQGGGQIGHIVKIYYFLTNRLLLLTEETN